jgi:lipopolysaccharide transport system ATP-binding protein
MTPFPANNSVRPPLLAGTPVLTARGLSKKFCRSLGKSLWYGVRDVGRELLAVNGNGRTILREEEFWAVRDVFFEVKPGEALGVVGSNGAGKSTLLKMLCGLIKPDVGEARRRGRIAALIELGAGFDPVLSGRENVYLNAALLGLSRAEVGALLPEIIEFSGLAEVLDSPVGSYSSGMKARLSFSVAAHLNPDIFIVDEVLAVGDFDFQRKCINHMLRYLERGGALILVSHNPYHIQSVCSSGILMENGAVTYSGTAVGALDRHLKAHLGTAHAMISSQEGSLSFTGDAAVRASAAPVGTDKRVGISEVRMESPPGGPLATGAPARISVTCCCSAELVLHWHVSLWTADQSTCITAALDLTPRTVALGSTRFQCDLPSLPLIAGNYLLKVCVVEASSFFPIATVGWQDAPLAFSVRSEPNLTVNMALSIKQLVQVEARWS